MPRSPIVAMMLGLALLTTAPGSVLAEELLTPAAASSRRANEAFPTVPLAADGYCVVTLSDRRQWQRGEARLAVVFDGQEYRFAGLRERDIFAATPEHYAPVLGGDCPVTLAELGEHVPGRLEFAVLHGDRLFFFADESRRDEFVERPARFVNADLVDGGRCPVSRRDERREVAGIPETVAMHNGQRLFFASAHHRTLFLMHPELYDASAAALAANSPTAEKQLDPGHGSTEIGGQGAAGHGQLAAGASGSRENGEDLLNSQPAMGGYCPVTIRQSGIWVRGRYDYRVEFDGLVLLTAGPAEHDALVNDPVRYIPALNSDCAVSLVDEGQRVRGSIFHAAEYQGRLFLFADAQHKAAFKSEPIRYASGDLAAEGTCTVTQVDDNRTVPGLAEFATWHAGRVFRFAGSAQLKKFLSHPERYATTSPVAKKSPPPEEAQPPAKLERPAPGQSPVAQ